MSDEPSISDPGPDPQFKRGAKKSPRHKLLAASPFRVPLLAPPAQFAVVPKRLSMWGNDQYGDCVSAQEAFSKAAFSTQCGLPETFIPEATVISWARQHGFLNGADLVEVMQAMASNGMTAEDGKVYTDGPYNGVDYSNENTLKSALTTGPVNVAIDANALPSGAGRSNGWWTTSSVNHPNTDHCVALCGYGPASYLFQALGVPMPAGLAPDTQGYLLFTWNTIGFVTHGWIMGTVVEAWVRNPTTPGQSPTPPGPGPCPPGQHWDMFANKCVPDDPTPPNPPQPPGPLTVTVSGTVGFMDVLMGRTVTFHGAVDQVHAGGGMAITLPPWILPVLKLLCAGAIILPPPWSMIVSAVCSLLPANHEMMAAAGQPVSVVLPPWLLPIIQAACAQTDQLPAPYNYIAKAVCSLLPLLGKGPCGGCK